MVGLEIGAVIVMSSHRQSSLNTPLDLKLQAVGGMISVEQQLLLLTSCFASNILSTRSFTVSFSSGRSTGAVLLFVLGSRNLHSARTLS